LQTALLDGGTIYVCPGTYRGGFSILKNVIIIGAGQGDDPTVDTILDGGQQDRVVITNTGAAVTLQGLRITGGKVTDDDGAGIFNLGQLTMTDCTVTANHAVAGQIGFGTGGGIRNSPSANLTMTNCTISQNSAALRAGGISLLQGTHTLTNCTFTGNTAGGQGGALFCNNGGATTLIGCTIGPGNDAEAGAIVVQNNSTLTLDATSVTGNTGTSIGGIGSSTGVVTLQNGSTVSGNSPNNCVGPINGPGCAP
jgi:predicted outer membrane repeat protein